MAKTQKAKAAPSEQVEKAKPQHKDAGPKAIILKSFYSFYDEDGSHRQWAPGVKIDDAADIAELIERGVEHEVAE